MWNEFDPAVFNKRDLTYNFQHLLDGVAKARVKRLKLVSFILDTFKQEQH